MINLFYITKSGDEYLVHAESGKILGRYKTRAEAEHRLRQIEYWKHHEKSSIVTGVLTQDSIKLK